MQTQSFLPRPVALSLKCILGVTLLCSLFSGYLLPYLGIALPASGHFHFWQLFTYPWIQLFPSELLSLFFNLYMLWVFGAGLIERMHQPCFLMLYLGASLAGGLAAFGAMKFFLHPLFFFGSAPVIYALLTSWVLLNKDSRLLLFFALPVKAANLLLFFVGFSLVVEVSTGNYTAFFASLAAVCYSYLFTLLSCRAKSSLSFLAPFENALLKILEKGEHLKNKKRYTRAKIYDFKSGEAILSDEEFMDAMLTRISLYGESNLTAEERAKMQAISLRKKR